MKKTPSSNRKHIVLFGETNVGKSALFNAILGQKRAIVSATPGTTTDPVEKAMELTPFGPVVLVDTAGLFDESTLGPAREAATRRVLETTDFAVYVTDQAEPPFSWKTMKETFEARKIPYLVVHSKADLQTSAASKGLTVSVYDEASIEQLKKILAEKLAAHTQADRPLIGDLLAAGSVAVLVIPIDSEAPKGRLILPQVQLIRDCLDHQIRCHICNEANLPHALAELPKIDLVITDAQIFKRVGEMVPQEIPFTAFSILMARQKGDLAALYAGAQAIKNVKDGDRVLIAEVCTHNRTHEDIGRVKLPRAIEALCGAKPAFDFVSGKDFPEDVSPYALIVQCGGCMITARAFSTRQEKARQVPMTNYGMVLALAGGILDRSMAFFFENKSNRLQVVTG